MRARIAGTGSYLPAQVITNKDLEKLVDTSNEWIVERTGIRERRKAAENEQTSDMCVAAARSALELAGWSAVDLDLIVVGTISPDRPLPSCAVFVQEKLGARNAVAFDVSAACAGSLFALSVAEKFVRTGGARRALVLGAELLTRIVDWKDRNTCVLFGDAAGAILLEATDEEDRGVLETHLHSDGAGADWITIPSVGAKVKMKGQEVFKFAVKALGDAIGSLGVPVSALDHVIAHQANLRIIECVCKRADVPMDKVWLNIDRYGNTSSASLPISLDEANRAGRLKRGDLIGMMAIGGGMAWGSALVRW